MRRNPTLAAGLGLLLNTLPSISADAAPPVVALDSPADGATWRQASSLSASATATDTDGVIVKVEFYLGSTLAGTSTSPTVGTLGLFEANLSPKPTNVGAYPLTARAYDSSGEITTSAPRTLNIAQSPSAPLVTTGAATFPYTSTFAALAGTVTAYGELSSGYNVYFEVGISTNYGSVTTPWNGLFGGGELVAVSLGIQNLTRGTTYHYRLVVRYLGNITYGEDATFTTPLNFAPTAQDRLIGLTEVGPRAIHVFSDLGNGYVGDRDGDPLTLAVRTLPRHGTVTLEDSVHGKYFSYTPNANFAAEDDFTYIVSDDHGGTATATIRVVRIAKRAAGRYVTTIEVLNDSGHAAGLLTLDVTSTRAFTGVLSLFGKRHPFIGQLSGKAETYNRVWIEPLGELPIGLWLRFGAGPLGVHLEGYVLTGDPRWISHTITPTAALISPKDAPEAGNYTVALSSSETGAYLGHGYLTGHVSKTGSVIFTGRTGDGQGFSFGTQLRPMSTAQLFVTAGPHSRDRINGSIQFPRADAEECTGELFWSKAPRASNFYSQRFEGRMSATGSRLHPVLQTPNILDYSSNSAAMDVVFHDLAGDELLAGSLTGPNESALTFLPAASSPTLPRVSLKVNHLRGTFSGSFQAPSENGITRNFAGVLLQHQNSGTGLIVIGRRTGSVSLTPR